MQKRANSQDFVEKGEIERFLAEARKSLRPQSSFRDIDSPYDSPYLMSENSNASCNSPKLSTKATRKDHSNSISRYIPPIFRGVKRIQEIVAFSYDLNDKQQKSKPKIVELCVKGRPLTANSEYSTKQKSGSNFGIKKRSSLHSCLDPKTFDEEYISIDEYTRALISHSEQRPVKNPPIVEESQEKSEILPVQVPVVVKSPQSPHKRIGLIVSTKLAFRTHAKTICSTRGKILKGLCNKPSVPRNNKLFHNILIS